MAWSGCPLPLRTPTPSPRACGPWRTTMTWFNSTVRFDHRAAVLFVSAKHMLIERAVFSVLANASQPDQIEVAVRDLIHKYRPALDCCAIFAMGFNQQWNRWEFSVSHASLPKVGLYAELPLMALDPALEG